MVVDVGGDAVVFGVKVDDGAVGKGGGVGATVRNILLQLGTRLKYLQAWMALITRRMFERLQGFRWL